mmetsp:Transcript_137152/g.242454  ORF Transcript_137152/g.242454 Transcript_137152/m.242454 type:complete len:341 (-) Transcript_137152:60-1082(-)
MKRSSEFHGQELRLNLASHDEGAISITNECCCPFCLCPGIVCTCGDLKLESDNSKAATYTYDANDGLLDREFCALRHAGLPDQECCGLRHAVYVDWSEHKEGGKIVSFSAGFPWGNLTKEDAGFDLMSNGTLADRKNPDVVLGTRPVDRKLVLVAKDDPNRCIFKAWLDAPGQASMGQVLGRGQADAAAPFRVNDAVTWTDAEDPYLGMVMEDNDVPRDAIGTVTSIVGDDAKVRFDTKGGPATVELKTSSLRKAQAPGGNATSAWPATSGPVSQPSGQSVASSASTITTPVSPVGQIMVEVPFNATPGAVIQAQAPTGQILQITVPPGARPGSHLTVQY